MRIDWHADDLGATPQVNKNILTVWRLGQLDGVSVIANGDALEKAAQDIGSDPQRPLRLVVHLNLSEGLPLSEPGSLPLIVNGQGEFCHGFMGLWNVWRRLSEAGRAQLLHKIRAEWALQIELVIRAFAPRRISGVDGHIHVHMLPFLFPVAAELAAEYGLPEIRISHELFHFRLRESFRLGYPSNILKHFLLNRLAGPARRIARTFDLAAPDAIAGVLYSGHMTRNVAAAAIKCAQHRQLRWQELIFHPGRAAESEKQRWANQQSIWQFYNAPARDMERDELTSRPPPVTARLS